MCLCMTVLGGGGLVCPTHVHAWTVAHGMAWHPPGLLAGNFTNQGLGVRGADTVIISLLLHR